MACISVIMVTYYPNKKSLGCLISNLSNQVDYIFIVDNTPYETISYSNDERVIYIGLNENKGIAAAHNIGIKEAIDFGSDFVLLLDQDSIPNKDMVSLLLRELESSTKNGVKVGAVGPLTYDPRTNLRDPFTSCIGGKVNALCPKNGETVKCDFLISSGCLIPVSVLLDIGMMNSDFFIDCVDIEWGFRATNSGYNLLGVSAARMQHEIGDNHLTVFNKKLTMHSPIRHYYYFRNFYYLLFKDYVPLCWKFRTFRRSLLQAIAFSLFSNDRINHLRYILLGVLHGLKGRLGPYES